MVNQISRIKIDRDIQILLQVTQNGKYLVLKIYEFNFKIKIYREEKKYHMTKQTKIGGGGGLLIWKENHMSMKPFLVFIKMEPVFDDQNHHTREFTMEQN